MGEQVAAGQHLTITGFASDQRVKIFCFLMTDKTVRICTLKTEY